MTEATHATEHAIELPGREIGRISHYYSHLGVAVVELTDDIHAGDKVWVKGHTSDFTQLVEHIEIEHHEVPEAHAGDSIGLKVSEHAREHDRVYVIS